MTRQFPKRLRDAPILEAIIEIRFRCDGSDIVSSVLPGLLFSKLSSDFPKTQPHPSAQIPAAFRQQNEQLRYLPSVSLVGDNSAIHIGPNVLGLVVSRPYPGWDKFKRDVFRIWEIAESSNVIRDIERFSIKYVNLVRAAMSSNQLELTTAKVSLGDHVVTTESTAIRTELQNGRFVTALNLVSQAVTIEEPPETGLIVDVDVICNGPFDGGWSEIKNLLEDAHGIEKEVFFGLLKESTIAAYDPEY